MSSPYSICDYFLHYSICDFAQGTVWKTLLSTYPLGRCDVHYKR